MKDVDLFTILFVVFSEEANDDFNSHKLLHQKQYETALHNVHVGKSLQYVLILHKFLLVEFIDVIFSGNGIVKKSLVKYPLFPPMLMIELFLINEPVTLAVPGSSISVQIPHACNKRYLIYQNQVSLQFETNSDDRKLVLQNILRNSHL
jgi:hypothetical protein